ncbi:hypothetical protein Tco_0546606, partial [Tanacetum coccineum]
VRSSKRAVEVGLDHEGSKKQKTNEDSESVQEQPDEEEKELPQEDLQQMMMVVPVEEFREGLLGFKPITLSTAKGRVYTTKLSYIARVEDSTARRKLVLPVIVNGDSLSPVASASAGAEGPIPPKTVEQKLARKNKLKAQSTLMLSIPDEHLLKFHVCKELSRIGLEATRNQRRYRRAFSSIIMKSLLHQVKKD